MAGVLCSRKKGKLSVPRQLPIFLSLFELIDTYSGCDYSQAGNIEEAGNVYWRAKKALINSTNFLEKHQLLR